MEPDVQSTIFTSLCPPSYVTDLSEYSLLHRHHEDITKVDLMLTEPSQVSKRSGERGAPEACASALRRLRRGHACFDLFCVLIAGAPMFAKRASVNNGCRVIRTLILH